jgi:hypothetical protein
MINSTVVTARMELAAHSVGAVREYAQGEGEKCWRLCVWRPGALAYGL